MTQATRRHVAPNAQPLIARELEHCELIVLRASEAPPLRFITVISQARSRRAVRIAGGCSGLDATLAENLLSYFQSAFTIPGVDGAEDKYFDGVMSSGGTLSFEKDGSEKQQVTTVPVYLASRMPLIAISTTPRTYNFRLHKDDGRLLVSEYGDAIYWQQHLAVVVEQDAANVLDWDGDLSIYLQLLKGWQEQGCATGVVAFNGGGVTWKEIVGTLKNGLPLIAIEGSGRKTDEFITKFREGGLAAVDGSLAEVDPALVSIVSATDAASLRQALIQRNLLG
jgi:hypothetical protein